MQQAGREVGAAGAVVLASPPAVAGLALAPPARVADRVAPTSADTRVKPSAARAMDGATIGGRLLASA